MKRFLMAIMVLPALGFGVNSFFFAASAGGPIPTTYNTTLYSLIASGVSLYQARHICLHNESSARMAANLETYVASAGSPAPSTGSNEVYIAPNFTECRPIASATGNVFVRAASTTTITSGAIYGDFDSIQF